MRARRASRPADAIFYADLRKRFESIPGVSSGRFAILIINAGRAGQAIRANEKSCCHRTRVFCRRTAFLTTMQIPTLAGR